MQVEHHKQGVPSWVELMTSDDTAALSFYEGLFGWTDDAYEMPDGGKYHIQQLQGDNVAAIGKQFPDEIAQGIPPHWSVYMAVDDVATVAAKVEAAGGTVLLPATDVMDAGRMAVILDPTNAVVSLWEARDHIGFGRMHEPGAISWCELITDDPKRAAAFLSAILDVPHEDMDMGAGAPPYTLIGPKGEQGAGVMGKTAEMGPMPNAWGVYFEVADADATVARAKGLGAVVLQEPTDIMPGRFAMLRDPQGAVFGIIKSNPNMGA